MNDIKRLQEKEERAWISISNSCDPLQPLEERVGDTLFALHKLSENGFPVLLITKNPRLLLTKTYQEALRKGVVKIQVSIPFLKTPLEPGAPPSEDRFLSVKELVKEGFEVSIRIDPVIPGPIGQSFQELKELVFRAKEAGVKKIYAKALRLMTGFKKIRPQFYESLLPLYRKEGMWCGSYYVLKNPVKEELLRPIWESVQEANMELFTCTDRVGFPGVRQCEFS
jgi:DNA repair photolyase